MPKKILLIEDDSDIRTLYTEILRENGFDVTESINGEEGAAKALTEEFDLILLDIMLPKKDGVTVLEELTKKEGGFSTPVVMLTNLGQEGLIRKCFDLGAKGYLIKSEYTPDQIVSEVKSFLT